MLSTRKIYWFRNAANASVTRRRVADFRPLRGHCDFAALIGAIDRPAMDSLDECGRAVETKRF